MYETDHEGCCIDCGYQVCQCIVDIIAEVQEDNKQKIVVLALDKTA